MGWDGFTDDSPEAREGDLHSQILSLRREVALLRAAGDDRGSGLEAQLGQARMEISRLEQCLSAVSATLAQTHQALDKVTTTTDATHDALNSFVERYGRDQIVVNAQAELSRLTTEWNARFAQRRHVRTLARGLVHGLIEDALSRGMVDQEILQAYSQERLIMEPSFWLAPAVVAVAARHSGDKARESRARSHALTLDRPKATLFFALTSSRQKRQSEAALWMDQYLAGLDPSDLGQEFSVVLDAVAGAELGFEALTYAQQAMTRWDREANAHLSLLPRQDDGASHLVRWQPWMFESGMQDSGRFNALAELCPRQWPMMLEGWQMATGVEGTIDYLQDTYSTIPAMRTPGSRTDIAFNHLIGQQDDDERDMNEQMERLRSIIDHGGQEPEPRLKSLIAFSPTERAKDFQRVLQEAIFKPESVELGYPARLLSLHCTWQSLRSAVLAAAEQSAAALPSALTITVDGWSCSLPADPPPPETIRHLLSDYRKHLEKSTDDAVSSVNPVWPRIFSFAAAAAVVGGFALFLGGAGAALATAVSVGLICAAAWDTLRVPWHRQRLRDDASRRQIAGSTQLTRAFAQHSRMMREWRECLSAIERLGAWSPAIPAQQPDPKDRP
ncbi:hypothetical protein LN042_31855 [Kitasatospora sp. RB6PN24]|uniref:hypothetical protein n=1 Tax=Kitasatospora humi TaxID=2893891 RepID=UPI001E408045|nr:hypothetical protein [Kitasatospora humi]MCC9311607.1 hypothetical protein [Kitasatospora humi]